jgi:hypothetical protein
MPDKQIKRCDVRVPIDLYNQIETIAVEEYNAPTYHKTGKPQVSSTIIELLKLGIANLRGEISVTSSDNISDTILRRLQNLESEVKDLRLRYYGLIASSNPVDESSEPTSSDTVPDTLADTQSSSDTAADNLSDKSYLTDTLSDSVSDISQESPSTENNLSESSEKLLPSKIDKASLAPIFEDEDSEEEFVDYQIHCTVTQLRKIVTAKGLSKKFREKLGKSPRESRKAEIIKFLEETSIFDCD